MDKLLAGGCAAEKKEKLCRSRGGESCAFDGAMIVLQPIADAAHVVHGPIACAGNSWEGRGAFSKKGALHRAGFTTAMDEMDIIYGSEDKLLQTIRRAFHAVKPKAVFVYSTCVSGLTGEDIDAVSRRAERELGVPVIPVNAPGFVGPKNLGNRIAGEALLERVIGTGEPAHNPPCPPSVKGGEGDMPSVKEGQGGTINLIGEYNIAGDLWLVEPLLEEAGIRVLSRITGDSTFEEITYAHRARLNVVVCGRALINVAKGMESKYGIPYIEASFFGKTETSKALRLIASNLESQISNLKSEISDLKLADRAEAAIKREEAVLEEKLRPYGHLRGKRAVLYTGGVKSWSFIRALMDLGIEVAAVGTKKSTLEDEEKMKEILGSGALLTEDAAPKNLARLMRETGADMLIAGGRNQYLAAKEGFPFVDVNQERHTPYAGYEGLINLAGDISRSMAFYGRHRESTAKTAEAPLCFIPLWKRGTEGDFINKISPLPSLPKRGTKSSDDSGLINPLKHSRSIGAAMAFQGIDRALPVIHGAQGCGFLGKVLLTKHFREPVSLLTTKLFAEDVVMGSEERLSAAVGGSIKDNAPDVVAVLTSGLSEVKGDDVASEARKLRMAHPSCEVVHVPTPDYEGGLEDGYAGAVEAVVRSICTENRSRRKGRVNVIAGSHLTPADFNWLREAVEAFGLTPVMLPDLSAMDGSRRGFSPLAEGGTKMEDIRAMAGSEFTLAVGLSMELAAAILKETYGVGYATFEGLAGLADTDAFLKTLSLLSGLPIAGKFERQRRTLVDGMRDAHHFLSGKRACLALEPDLSVQASRCLYEAGADVALSVIPQAARSAEKVLAREVRVGDLFGMEGEFDIMISNSHAEDAATRLGVPLYQMGFPVYKTLGYTSRVTIGYAGTLGLINDVANLLMRRSGHEDH